MVDVSDDESELPWAMYRSLDPAFKKIDEEEQENWELGDDQDVTGNQLYFMKTQSLRRCKDGDHIFYALVIISRSRK